MVRVLIKRNLHFYQTIFKNIGKWLQIRIEKDFLNTIVESLKGFNAETAQLPRIFDFSEKNLRFIVNHLTPTNMIH